MNTEPEKMPEDEQPKSGAFVDSEGFYQDLTPEEIAAGEHLGAETPDVDYIEDDDGAHPVGGDGS